MAHSLQNMIMQQRFLNLNNEASYWLGNRNRIKDQFVVYNQQGKNKFLTQ